MQEKLAILAVVICLACDGKSHKARLSPELIVFGGARKIETTTAAGYERVNYEVEVPYPARAVIRSLAGQLASQGWRPTRNNWFNRDQASEYLRGWVQSTVVGQPGEKEQFLARWWAQWQNGRGDVVDYCFTYLSPGEQFTNRSVLYVQAAKMSATFGQQFTHASQASAAGRPVILLPVRTPPNVETATDNSPDPRIFRVRPDGG